MSLVSVDFTEIREIRERKSPVKLTHIREIGEICERKSPVKLTHIREIVEICEIPLITPET
jgi:hypothetical protein